MSWTRRRIAVAVVLYALYAQRLYQYLLEPVVHFRGETRPLNLVPFKTIYGYLTDSGTPLEHRIYEIAGNLLVFAPVALLLALALRRFKVWPILLVSFGSSLTVETLQYALATGRSADVDDVICNVSGAAVAYVLIAAVLHLCRPDRFPSLRLWPARTNSPNELEINTASASRAP